MTSCSFNKQTVSTLNVICVFARANSPRIYLTQVGVDLPHAWLRHMHGVALTAAADARTRPDHTQTSSFGTVVQSMLFVHGAAPLAHAVIYWCQCRYARGQPTCNRNQATQTLARTQQQRPLRDRRRRAKLNGPACACKCAGARVTRCKPRKLRMATSAFPTGTNIFTCTSIRHQMAASTKSAIGI